MRFFCYSTIFKIPFLCTLPISFAQKTYDEPKMKKSSDGTSSVAPEEPPL